jgi:AcrR family transcriptional regulator
MVASRDKEDYSPVMSRKRSGPQSGSGTGEAQLTELPVLPEPPRERADAARNRRKVLDAAERLFAQHGIAAVTMDEVAAAAGVGKGTLYRRFTDKGGLAVALLDERERELQQAIISGPPPLGPGARPPARIGAFLTAYTTFLDAHGGLVAMSETNSVGARFRTGVYQFWRLHLTNLLREAAVAHPGLRAELLLAPLSAESYQQLRRSAPAADIAAALTALATASPGRPGDTMGS